jgi:hypothetical protein
MAAGPSGLRRTADERNAPVRTSTCAAAGLALLFGLAAGAAADAQGADPVFAAFREACLVSGAEPAAVAKATEHGWSDGDMTGTPIPGFVVDNKVMKSTRIGAAELKLFDWHGVKGAIGADECQVSVNKAGFEAVRSAAATSLGFAAQQTAPDKSVFQFQGTAEAPKPIEKTDFDAAAGSGGVMLLTISKQGNGVFLELLRIRK